VSLSELSTLSPGAAVDDPIVAGYVDSGLIDLRAVDLVQLAGEHCSPDSALGRSVARVLAIAANLDEDASGFQSSL
jgi:FXSXX-COOH protein